MIAGCASSNGTASFAGRFHRNESAGFYRTAQDLRVSSIGLGTYLGEMDDATDRGYTESIFAAIRMGLNFIDTSLNYRNQRSERAVGTALEDLLATGAARRDELVVSTKAGFLVPDAVPAKLDQSQIIEGAHSISPEFLADQLERSRANLGLETIDVFYLHNPEMQLSRLPRDEFHDRIRRAFAFLEEAAGAGKLRFYGTATWHGYRRPGGAPDGLSLPALAEEARRAGGPGHHFRFIQLPFNLAMPEAYVQAQNASNVLGEAHQLGITVIASASLLQARLARNLPPDLAAKFPGAATDAQRALQYTRSTPGITVALAGMSTPDHVRENLGIAAVPSLTEKDYRTLYRRG